MEPEECACTSAAVETIEETLGCPLAWRWVPEAAVWLHVSDVAQRNAWLRSQGVS